MLWIAVDSIQCCGFNETYREFTVHREFAGPGAVSRAAAHIEELEGAGCIVVDTWHVPFGPQQKTEVIHHRAPGWKRSQDTRSGWEPNYRAEEVNMRCNCSPRKPDCF